MSSSLLQSARFLTSASTPKSLPVDTGSEVAFVGRSNSGKSSAINRLTNQKHLARASSTPGRTRLINFFSLESAVSMRLVDLPGYGFARASKTERAKWSKLVNWYLQTRQSLTGLVLLLDIRHEPKPADIDLITWVKSEAIPLLILATKADKLSKSSRFRALAQLAAKAPDTSLVAFSSVSGCGEDDAKCWVLQHLDPNLPEIKATNG